MNAESERVDADQCAGESKTAAGVVELCTFDYTRSTKIKCWV